MLTITVPTFLVKNGKMKLSGEFMSEKTLRVNDNSANFSSKKW